MNEQEKILYKQKLKLAAIAIIEERIAAAKKLMDDAQQAANSEEKSSAGDKYETSRAMSHLEKDMHARQMAEQLKELSTLHAVAVDHLYEEVKAGSFIRTSTQDFFVAAGLGKQMIDGKMVIFLSPQAPLSKLLWGKKKGEEFLFAVRKTKIDDLF